MFKTALDKYNKRGNLAIVSSYPNLENGKFSNVSGVATYTYHMLPDMMNTLKPDSGQIIVLSEKVARKASASPIPPNGLIAHCWNRKSPHVFGQIAGALLRLSRVNKVLFHFEFNMYADMFVTGTLPFYLLWLKIFGRKDVTLLLHQVVENLDELEGHLNVRAGSMKGRIFGVLLRLYYKVLLFSVNKIVVHDEILRHRLKKFTKRPIFVIPHGLGEYQSMCERVEAREETGLSHSDFVVLCFGFLTWYKGSDWVIDQFVNFYKETKDTSVKLILAGGESPTLKGKPHYDSYFNRLKEISSKYPNIKITGFVPEDKVYLYYCAADVVLLPYRTQMSASGPFSIGLSFGRPFLLSENLAGVLDTKDVKEMMEQYKLKKEDLLFKLSKKDLFERILHLVENKEKVSKLAAFSGALSSERNWKKIVKEFLMVINA